jgi:hypothetical protein
MELTPAKLVQYERDGFLIFPDLFTSAEIAVLRQEVARLAKLDTSKIRFASDRSASAIAIADRRAALPSRAGEAG